MHRVTGHSSASGSLEPANPCFRHQRCHRLTEDHVRRVILASFTRPPEMVQATSTDRKGRVFRLLLTVRYRMATVCVGRLPLAENFA